MLSFTKIGCCIQKLPHFDTLTYIKLMRYEIYLKQVDTDRKMTNGRVKTEKFVFLIQQYLDLVSNDTKVKQ